MCFQVLSTLTSLGPDSLHASSYCCLLSLGVNDRMLHCHYFGVYASMVGAVVHVTNVGYVAPLVGSNRFLTLMFPFWHGRRPCQPGSL